MQAIEPVAGWSLNYIVSLDVHAHGTAGAFLRASTERRHVIAALLSAKPLPDCPSESVRLAQFIGTGTHRDILKAAFGDVPSGLRGALARSGPQPHPPTFYRMLHKLLSDPGLNTAAVIKQLDRLDPKRLLIVQRLPVPIRAANLVKAIEHPRTATDVATLFSLFSNNGIDADALAEALRRVSSADQLSALWDRWSHKLVFPPHPLPATEHHVPVTSGSELRRLALRHRNCARHYITKIMEGDAAFSEFHWAGTSAVIHLKRREGMWKLEDIFGRRNGQAPSAVVNAAQRFLEERGVCVGRNVVNNAGEWGALGRLSARLMYDF